MSLNANTAAGGGTKFDQMEAGTYPTRLVAIVDLGVQTQRPFGDQVKDPVQEIALTYEFVDEFMKDEDGQDQTDKPRWLTETMPFYNLTADRAKSTARYNALDPTGAVDGDWLKLLGAPCMVTVVLNPNKKSPGSFWENIAAVMSMREKDAKNCAPLVNAARYFDFDAPDLEMFLALPKFLQKKIKEGLTYEGSTLAKLLDEGTGPAKTEADDMGCNTAPSNEDGNPY